MLSAPALIFIREFPRHENAFSIFYLYSLLQRHSGVLLGCKYKNPAADARYLGKSAIAFGIKAGYTVVVSAFCILSMKALFVLHKN